MRSGWSPYLHVPRDINPYFTNLNKYEFRFPNERCTVLDRFQKFFEIQFLLVTTEDDTVRILLSVCQNGNSDAIAFRMVAFSNWNYKENSIHHLIVYRIKGKFPMQRASIQLVGVLSICNDSKRNNECDEHRFGRF